MAFYIGSTSIYPGVIPTPNEINNGSVLSNDGGYAYWSYPGNAHTTAGGYDWRYRTILTHGYTAAGYKGSNPWRSVNKTWHQTDTTVYCGEQVDKAAAYIDGTWSDYNAYVHGTSDGFQTAATHTSSYNLFNGIMRMQNDTNFTFFGSGGAPYGYTGNNPAVDGLTYGSGQASPNSTGGWDMSVSRNNIGCASNQGYGGEQAGGAGYIFGGSSTTVNRLHFPSEVMYATTASPVTWVATDAVGAESYAFIVGSAGNYYFTYSNQTFTAYGFNGGTSDGNNKSLMTKYGFYYSGVGGNTDTRRWKFNTVTFAYISQISKLGNFGEENQQMGQDWGYMMGQYNGQQNNWATKTTYSNDAQVTLGFSAQPKGHYGTSSGACSTAAASVVGVQRA